MGCEAVGSPGIREAGGATGVESSSSGKLEATGGLAERKEWVPAVAQWILPLLPLLGLIAFFPAPATLPSLAVPQTRHEGHSD